jgi:phosphoribosylaminoimidazolecarboxamide formyltransferase/IMP cyclohydrolase
MVSVTDKTGLVPFMQGLVALGFEIVSTGGTRKHLLEKEVPVTEVSQYTGFPEMMDGRLKTLHPRVHGGLLGRPEDLAIMNENGIQPFELLVCNLYAFEQTVASGASPYKCIENIDIGGPAMLRSAAKNNAYLGVVTSPDQYDRVLEELRAGPLSAKSRLKLARRAFAHTAKYDIAISNYFGGLVGEEFPDPFFLVGSGAMQLRCGENPHQRGRWYPTDPAKPGPLGGKLLQEGKGCSYVNFLDLSAAFRTVMSFEEPATCINKHASPCGIAMASTLVASYEAAFASDKKSALGGVYAFNRVVTLELVQAIGKRFVECIIAPGFEADALEALRQKTDLRIVDMGTDYYDSPVEARTTIGGVLVQDVDRGDPPDTQWEVVSKRQPTETEWQSLRFAWRACPPVVSNAIVFVQGTATVGIGGGQPNRVDCVIIAGNRAEDKAQGGVMASDAFFPFDDSIREAHKRGIRAVIFTGGGKQDAAVIAAADELDMVLIKTGVRHFRH